MKVLLRRRKQDRRRRKKSSRSLRIPSSPKDVHYKVPMSYQTGAKDDKSEKVGKNSKEVTTSIVRVVPLRKKKAVPTQNKEELAKNQKGEERSVSNQIAEEDTVKRKENKQQKSATLPTLPLTAKKKDRPHRPAGEQALHFGDSRAVMADSDDRHYDIVPISLSPPRKKSRTAVDGKESGFAKEKRADAEKSKSIRRSSLFSTELYSIHEGPVVSSLSKEANSKNKDQGSAQLPAAVGKGRRSRKIKVDWDDMFALDDDSSMLDEGSDVDVGVLPPPPM